MSNFTKMEQKILNVFADGLPHGQDELLEVVKPSGWGTVRVHLRNIRAKLPANESIVCILSHGKLKYRWVLFRSAED